VDRRLARTARQPGEWPSSSCADRTSRIDLRQANHLLTPSEEQLNARTAALRFDIGLLAGRLVALTDWLVDQEQTADLGSGCSAPGPARRRRWSRPRRGPPRSRRSSPAAGDRISPAGCFACCASQSS
jgi:hypothetical protein